MEEKANAMKSFRFVLFLLLQVWTQLQLAVSHSTLKYLPGFEGPLPFELETGYIGVDKSQDVQLFYYFIQSEGNPKHDPLILWLTGGPGCSAFSGLVFEIGPLKFDVVDYNGTLPTLVLNPHSWTQVSSIIFVDSPVCTGFSYAKTSLGCQSGDFIQIRQLDEFLRQWLKDHPEFLSNPVYVAGDSYSGLTVPAIAQKISIGNEEGEKPVINLKGVIVGNPSTDMDIDYYAPIPYAHGKGFISDQLFESLKRSCGEYKGIDPRNEECAKHMQEYYKCTFGINTVQILEPLCGFGSPSPTGIFGRRFFQDYYHQLFLDFIPPIPPVDCRAYAYVLSGYWANKEEVRRALHIQEGSMGKWQRCNYGINYTSNIVSSIQYHVYLGIKGYRSLIYSGDHDMGVPFIGTEKWIRSLNYSIIDDWRPWHHDAQVAGYTRTYSNRLTFATVKGGGHTAPEYQPAECLAMYKRWIREKAL